MPSTLAFPATLRRPCRSPRSARLAALLLAAGLGLSGCATTQDPDPLESMNRKTFALNEGVDRFVLKPAATAYEAAVPAPVRTGVSNFFSNLGDPWSGVNAILQGRVKDGLSDFGRFGTNTTVGLLGVMDVATGWGMPHQGESFNDTLRVWGVAGGAYLVLPLFGPSDLRGLAAWPVNTLASAPSQIGDAGTAGALTLVGVVDQRARLLSVTRMIDEVALDKYSFVRDAYLQRRLQREAGPAGDGDGDGGGDSEGAAEAAAPR
ncbi:ABC transporter [Methylibium sp. Pch-M]|uniref:MlaA family lipoprotein n=1 Tax=Methylibium sp. Pch-M TaxID=2082386 RepID=UPI0010117305|nr:VacJ family lipoprotein [Methylibium sp. Pch-M]QAZ39098.1 ABC transporter [Methylibium sp. Pch-M]